LSHTFSAHTAPSDSDLAHERSRADIEGESAIYRERELADIRIAALRLTEEGGRRIQKPAGRYLSLSFPPPALWSAETEKRISDALAAALLCLLPHRPSRVLIAGIGNRRLTPDAFGPLTADKVRASAALPEEIERLGLCLPSRTAVFVPDVFAHTGIDSVKSISAAARLSEAGAVIAVDALAAAERERLLTVLEITDTGTVPGGGVKRGGSALSQSTLGIPVLSIGLPAVIRADGSHLLIPRDLEQGVAAIADATAAGINAAFDGSAAPLPFSLASLFSEEEP
jgi:spore protease